MRGFLVAAAAIALVLACGGVPAVATGEGGGFDVGFRSTKGNIYCWIGGMAGSATESALAQRATCSLRKGRWTRPPACDLYPWEMMTVTRFAKRGRHIWGCTGGILFLVYDAHGNEVPIARWSTISPGEKLRVDGFTCVGPTPTSVSCVNPLGHGFVARANGYATW